MYRAEYFEFPGQTPTLGNRRTKNATYMKNINNSTKN